MNFSLIKKYIKYIAIISLIIAFFAGKMIESNGLDKLVKDQFYGMNLEKVNNNPLVYNYGDQELSLKKGFIVVETTQGWGGPFISAVDISSEGVINKLVVLKHRETPSFYNSLQNRKFFDQFKNKNISDNFELEDDISAVSGATVSSNAFSKAVRVSSHWLARDQFDIAIVDKPIDWKLESDEYILILLYGVVLISIYKKYRKVRLALLAFSTVFIGFYLNTPLSISNLAALIMGYYPAFYEYTFWWLLIGGTIMITILYGKNIYCSWICPFGGMQELISKIGGISIKFSRRHIKYLDNIIYVLLWSSMMIVFLTNNPSLGAFEPFATLFSFKGMGIQWYLVSIAILASFIIPRFWCRFFCPVGVVLNYLTKVRKKVLGFLPILRMTN